MNNKNPKLMIQISGENTIFAWSFSHLTRFLPNWKPYFSLFSTDHNDAPLPIFQLWIWKIPNTGDFHKSIKSSVSQNRATVELNNGKIVFYLRIKNLIRVPINIYMHLVKVSDSEKGSQNFPTRRVKIMFGPPRIEISLIMDYKRSFIIIILRDLK